MEEDKIEVDWSDEDSLSPILPYQQPEPTNTDDNNDDVLSTEQYQDDFSTTIFGFDEFDDTQNFVDNTIFQDLTEEEEDMEVEEGQQEKEEVGEQGKKKKEWEEEKEKREEVKKEEKEKEKGEKQKREVQEEKKKEKVVKKGEKEKEKEREKEREREKEKGKEVKKGEKGKKEEKEKKMEVKFEDEFFEAPTRAEVEASLAQFDIPAVRYDPPFFGKPSDRPGKLVPGFQTNIGQGQVANEAWPGKSCLYEMRKENFEKVYGVPFESVNLEFLTTDKRVTLQTMELPPSREEVEDWIRVRAAMEKIQKKKEKVKPVKPKPKILIRQNPDDSEGSVITCSPVSSLDSSPERSHGKNQDKIPANDHGQILDISPRKSQDKNPANDHGQILDISPRKSQEKSPRQSGPSPEENADQSSFLSPIRSPSSTDSSPIPPSPTGSSPIQPSPTGSSPIAPSPTGSSPIPPSPGSSPIPPSPQSESISVFRENSQRSKLKRKPRRSVRNSRTSIFEQSFISKLEEEKEKEDIGEESLIIPPSQDMFEQSQMEVDPDTTFSRETSMLKRKISDDMFAESPDLLADTQQSTNLSQSPGYQVFQEIEKSADVHLSDDRKNKPSVYELTPDVDTATPTSKRVSRLQARKRLKRRISWQLPQQDSSQLSHLDSSQLSQQESLPLAQQQSFHLSQQESLQLSQQESSQESQLQSYQLPQQQRYQQSPGEDEIAKNETMKSLDFTDFDMDESRNLNMETSHNFTLSNEDTQGSSMESTAIAQSILDKLNDTELMKRYLTPREPVESLSYVEPPVTAPPVRPVDLQNVARAERNDHMSMLVMELLCESRGTLLPDPLVDAIQGVFYSVVRPKQTLSGCIIVSPGKVDLLARTGITGWRVRYVETEELLLKNVVRLVRDADPDILAGYEIQMESWGLFFQRAFHLGMNLCPLVSRVPDSVRESKIADEEENPGAQYNADHTSEINLVGRIVFNSWRILRSELVLTSYTLQNVAMSVLGRRIPHFTHQVLTKAWNKDKTRYKAARYMLLRLEVHNEILARLDLLSRTSELARLFGIQFFEVFSRGSQFRVESSMLRLAKPHNYIAISPTRQQLAAQAAPEYLALLLEPESRLYEDPVIVLDFQSLYPSIIIGYNYCYSTCLGRVHELEKSGNFTFGCSSLEFSARRLEALRDHITISPAGVVFLKPNIRKGILPKMLQDILSTRIMVKNSMKAHKKNPDIQKVLHSRQLGLKLIANVTYGYTSANFSGRMPCIEIGDSVVSKAREALEDTIRTIENRPEWGGRVIYGDTDSVFVLLKGKTKDQAFDIGEEIARVITEKNPQPMKLKFEKVYLPCILQTKKRYVGYMYESRDQEKPEFDAKGIETVRRDGIPATVKILEKSIRILFETKDISQVKSYVQSQFKKIISGTLALQDLTFAKEFRGMNGYRPTASVPALELTRNKVKKDRRKVPRTGERVPYIVIYGEPGLPLIHLVRDPQEVLINSELRPNAQYYITKVIVPPLNRCMLLVGVDTMSWYNELPRSIKAASDTHVARRGAIAKYFITQSCASCGKYTMGRLCDKCRKRGDRTGHRLSNKIHIMEKYIQDSLTACVKCTGEIGFECNSIDCPQFYRRINSLKKQDEVRTLAKLLEEL